MPHNDSGLLRQQSEVRVSMANRKTAERRVKQPELLEARPTAVCKSKVMNTTSSRSGVVLVKVRVSMKRSWEKSAVYYIVVSHTGPQKKGTNTKSE